MPHEDQEVVVEGKKNKYLDTVKIEKAIEDGWIIIKEKEIDKGVREHIGEIDMGELGVINLAMQMNSKLVLMDDFSARMIAESCGLNVKGTIYVLLFAFRRKIISKN